MSSRKPELIMSKRNKTTSDYSLIQKVNYALSRKSNPFKKYKDLLELDSKSIEEASHIISLMDFHVTKFFATKGRVNIVDELLSRLETEALNKALTSEDFFLLTIFASNNQHISLEKYFDLLDDTKKHEAIRAGDYELVKLVSAHNNLRLTQDYFLRLDPKEIEDLLTNKNYHLIKNCARLHAGKVVKMFIDSLNQEHQVKAIAHKNFKILNLLIDNSEVDIALELLNYISKEEADKFYAKNPELLEYFENQDPDLIDHENENYALSKDSINTGSSHETVDRNLLGGIDYGEANLS